MSLWHVSQNICHWNIFLSHHGHQCQACYIVLNHQGMPSLIHTDECSGHKLTTLSKRNVCSVERDGQRWASVSIAMTSCCPPGAPVHFAVSHFLLQKMRSQYTFGYTNPVPLSHKCVRQPNKQVSRTITTDMTTASIYHSTWCASWTCEWRRPHNRW